MKQSTTRQKSNQEVKNKNKNYFILLYDVVKSPSSMVSTGDRSAKIRTYNFSQGRITDHRINYTAYKLDAILDGDISELIEQLKLAEQQEQLAGD